MQNIDELQKWFFSIDSLTDKDEPQDDSYEMSFIMFYISFKTYDENKRVYATLVYDDEDILTVSGSDIVDALRQLKSAIEEAYRIEFYNEK